MEKATAQGIQFLKNIQQENGAICDTVNPLFNLWETILATTTLYISIQDTNDSVIRKALHYLKQNENNSGLICHNQKCKTSYCLETTSQYFSLLLQTGQLTLVESRMNEIMRLQKSTGEWEIGNPDVNEQRDFPSVTALVTSLYHEGYPDSINDRSLEWLVQQQKPQGHWGYAWEYYGCPAYALWAAMKAMKGIETLEIIKSRHIAIDYIVSQQLLNGSWYFKDPQQNKQISAELQTAWMLLALQNAGLRNKIVLQKGVDYLLQTQDQQGAWYGGYFPIPDLRYKKQEYVAATAMALQVFLHELNLEKSK
ncbi:MAG: hypothetical protein JNJ58_08480 [Chitinophagaceae bacterium]|nr:hypothetical protein [Chitinophagaceae bacterium]